LDPTTCQNKVTNLAMISTYKEKFLHLKDVVQIIVVTAVLLCRLYYNFMSHFFMYLGVFSLLLHRTSILIDFLTLSIQQKMAKFQHKLGKQILKENSESPLVASLKHAHVH
jgi:hypothetical protein